MAGRGAWRAAVVLLGAGVSAAAAPPAPAPPEAGHITGVGGIFFRSANPTALMAWYRDVLGLPLESWGGITLRPDAVGHPPVLVLNAFDQASDYLAPSSREFMLNFAVDDLSAFLTRLRAHGVQILREDDSDPTGRFAWILDPDGTKIELWQAKAKPAR